MLLNIIVSIVAGLGAGVATGFAGLSAATVISPLMIGVLGMPAYDAMVVSLSSDVLASAVSAIVYYKNKHINLQKGMVMGIAVVLMTIVGSIVGSLIPSTPMGYFSILMTLAMGLRFVFAPNLGLKQLGDRFSLRAKILQSAACGLYVGLVCGFVGVGGGMMMLFVLTMIMGLDTKEAVGTSVFIMTFAALVGAISHIVIAGIPNIEIMITCIVSTLVGAEVTAILANHVSEKIMNHVVGWMLIVVGVIMFFFHTF